MKPLNPAEIKSSFVNTSRSQLKAMPLPADLAARSWDDLDFLGWRDARAPARAYLVIERDAGPVGLSLRTATSGAQRRGSSMCDICHSVQSGGDVLLYVARKAGPLGRQGNSVGTYICADLACSLYVRGLRRLDLPQGDTAPRDQRVERVRRRIDSFAERALAG